MPSFLRWHLAPDQQQIGLSRHFNAAKEHRHESSRGALVLVQCVEDNYYFALFGQIISSLRERQPLRVEQFVLRSLNVGESRSIASFIKLRLINALFNYKWTRLYGSFCDGIGYRSTSFKPLSDAIDLYHAWKCWRGLSGNKALIELVIHNVPAGDLINDSYLRCKPAPTVDLRDAYLWVLIWQALRDIRRATVYFMRAKPALYLTSYSTYIQHGVAVRVALQCGVPVFSFGNYQEFAKKLSLTDWVQTKNPDLYAKIFPSFPEQEEKLALAETILSARMAGTIDYATSYMKKSAYVESGEAVPDVNGAAVVFLHDFYDSPHIYREMVFPDFWEWACFTIETLSAEGIPFFVKPHPNQITLSDAALNKLKKRYPDMRIIPSSITNKQLAEAGMTCAVTVYGTVASEMAFLGVPSVTCAHHPHVSFDFCKTAKSKNEYAEFLHSCNKTCIDKVEMRRQSKIFYYVHNLHLEPEDKSLLEFTGKLRVVCATPEVDSSSLVYDIKELSSLHGYINYISMWSGALRDVNRKVQPCD